MKKQMVGMRQGKGGDWQRWHVTVSREARGNTWAVELAEKWTTLDPRAQPGKREKAEEVAVAVAVMTASS